MTSHYFTVSELAKSFGLSRSALLYYDRLGLLTPCRKNGSNYRLYSEGDAERLERICLHRRLGIPLEEIKQLVSGAAETEAAEILQRRLNVLSREIADLQRQQPDLADRLRHLGEDLARCQSEQRLGSIALLSLEPLSSGRVARRKRRPSTRRRAFILARDSRYSPVRLVKTRDSASTRAPSPATLADASALWTTETASSCRPFSTSAMARLLRGTIASGCLSSALR